MPKQKILNEFNSGSEVKISMRTFEQYLKNNWFPEKSLRGKTCAWKEASLARISWDKTWRLLTVASYWKRIIFSDGCTVKFGHNFRVCEYNKDGEGSHRPDIYGVKPATPTTRFYTIV